MPLVTFRHAGLLMSSSQPTMAAAERAQRVAYRSLPTQELSQEGVRRVDHVWDRRVPDEPWARVAPILEGADPPRPAGRLRIDPRAALDASVYRLRSGVQWKRLPEAFPDDSSVHRTLRRWVRLGVLDRVWGVLVADCTEYRAQSTNTYSSTSLRRLPDRCSFLALPRYRHSGHQGGKDDEHAHGP